MLRLMIFDLDGTLLKTEELKALSYAKAAVQLCPYTISEDDVIEAFKNVVGQSRQEVAKFLIDKFDLESKAKNYMQDFHVSIAWQAYIQLRLKFYNEMLSHPQTLINNQWEHNVGLLNLARDAGCHTALATMSYREQVIHILSVLNWSDKFDFIATRDDVEHAKPSPEICELVRQELEVDASQCLVIEDSVVGVTAALNANMRVVAVAGSC